MVSRLVFAPLCVPTSLARRLCLVPALAAIVSIRLPIRRELPFIPLLALVILLFPVLVLRTRARPPRLVLWRLIPLGIRLLSAMVFALSTTSAEILIITTMLTVITSAIEMTFCTPTTTIAILALPFVLRTL